MNKYEKIADARRMQLRKSLADLEAWSKQASSNNYLDTENTLEILLNHAQGIARQVEEAGNKAGEE